MTVETELRPDLGYVALKVAGMPDMPASWAAIIGEIAHNLRSALNHLTWQLAILNLGSSQSPRRETAFPICTEPDDWLTKGTKKMVRDISPWHRAMIKARQPYQGINKDDTGPFAPLVWLNVLSNLDKHAAPALMRSAPDPFDTYVEIVGFSGASAVQPRWYIGPVLQTGTELIRLELTDPEPDASVHMNYKFAPKVHFGDGNGPVVDVALEEVLRCVTRVTGDFVRVFPAHDTENGQ